MMGECGRFDDCARRYRAALAELAVLAAAGPLTLVTATRDPELSHVTVLADVLDCGEDAGSTSDAPRHK